LHEAIDRYERDSTICDIEQGGEFPQRFYLTSRCVVWDLPGGNARAPCNSRDAHDARTAGLTIDVNGAGPALRDATAGPLPVRFGVSRKTQSKGMSSGASIWTRSPFAVSAINSRLPKVCKFLYVSNTVPEAGVVKKGKKKSLRRDLS
jgi:hypothetical protein